ncbi:MAG: YebC/PmpR family DNA-binding transcriptional regulator [candidate division WS1 bacterium]|jgi:YebC/PmpR family DNA-binding regulatory protein|nr:YebC/PmpR family DNA-binding transcriptional regulator [candidate division WS1 bacterium]
MAGHSKWANIQHRKGRQDEKRGRLFAKISRNLIVTAREGGGDPATNPKLRTIVEEAKAAEMPKDKIEYAIKRGTGEIEGASYEHMRYEGFGPAGVALIVEVLSDNMQRTVADIRSIMKRHGGNLGAPGSVTWMFEPKGLIVVPQELADEETVFTAAVEAGAEDVQGDEDNWEILTAPEALTTVVEAVRDAGLMPERAELTMLPTNTTPVEDAEAPKVLKLLDELNDNDDVQQVYANFEISDAALEALAS